MLRRLLIVEDDAPLRQMLTWELEDLGYAVTAVGSCREALALISRSGFDLALLDYGLPDGNGIELMEQLHSRWPELSVVLNSGQAGADSKTRALERGAVSFVTKPTASARLHRLFQSALADR